MYRLVFLILFFLFFFFNDTATTEIYTLSLHDALPISDRRVLGFRARVDRSGLAALHGEASSRMVHRARRQGGRRSRRPGETAERPLAERPTLRVPSGLCQGVLGRDPPVQDQPADGERQSDQAARIPGGRPAGSVDAAPGGESLQRSRADRGDG